MEVSKRVSLALNNQWKNRIGAWKRPNLLQIFMVLSFGAQLWTVFIFIRYAFSYIALPYASDFGEGALLDQTLRLASFENIYPPKFPPYTISNYPPIFPLVQVPLAWLFGPAYWYGKLLSTVSTIGTATFLGLTIHHLTKDKFAGVTGALIFLSIPFVIVWAPQNRIDCLALALTWAGLFVISRYAERFWSIPIAALLFTASAFTRQNYVLAGPVAAFIWLMGYRGAKNLVDLRYRAVLLLALVAIFVIGTFSILQYWTNGGFLYHAVKATMNEFLWARVRMFLLGMINLIPIFLTTAAIFLLLGPILKLQSWWLAAPYFLCAFISALTIGKIGSDVNYLLELSAAVCLATGLALGSLRQTFLKLILLTAVTVQIFLLGFSAQPKFQYRIEAFAARSPELDRAMKTVKECKGIVLADELMTLIPLAGKRIYYQPFTMVQNAREGKWNEAPFVNEIKQKKFALILMKRSSGAFWTPAMKDAITNSYVLVDRFRIFKDDPVRVYRPQVNTQ